MKHFLKKSLSRMFGYLRYIGPGTWAFRVIVAFFFGTFLLDVFYVAEQYTGHHVFGAFAYGAAIVSELLASLHDRSMKYVKETFGIHNQIERALMEMYQNKQAEVDRLIAERDGEEVAPDTERNPTTVIN